MFFGIVRGYIVHPSAQLGPDTSITDIGAGTWYARGKLRERGVADLFR